LACLQGQYPKTMNHEGIGRLKKKKGRRSIFAAPMPSRQTEIRKEDLKRSPRKIVGRQRTNK